MCENNPCTYFFISCNFTFFPGGLWQPILCCLKLNQFYYIILVATSLIRAERKNVRHKLLFSFDTWQELSETKTSRFNKYLSRLVTIVGGKWPCNFCKGPTAFCSEPTILLPSGSTTKEILFCTANRMSYWAFSPPQEAWSSIEHEKLNM